MTETTEMKSDPARRNARLMISYSRKDKEFVRQLHEGLLARGFSADEIWVDWEGIPLSADWMAEITKGIQAANVFVFVISPDSVASEVCAKEIAIAAESNKRFVPILYREPGKGAPLHEKISSHNWVFCRDQEQLEQILPNLVQAINTDLDWLARHTRWQNRALEWNGKQRNESSLPRGSELQELETFIGEGATGKDPSPTPLHVDYVTAARRYAATIRQRNRVITAVVGVILLGLTIFALIQRGQAVTNLQVANTQQSIAQAKATEANEQRATAQANEVIAQKNARVANSLALASEAVIQKGNDTQLALMLALLSIQETQPDGTLLLESQSALFASLNSPNVLQTWESGAGVVWAVAYDPLGRYVAFGGDDGKVHVLALETRKEVYTLEFGGQITGLDFSPDGASLAASSVDGTAQVFNTETGLERFALAGHEGAAINDIGFSPDGAQIATGGDDALVKLWSAETGGLRVSLPGHEGSVNALDFSSATDELVSGSDDGTAIIWDIRNNNLLQKLRPGGFNASPVNSVAFSANGERVITGGYKTVVVWNAANGSEIQQLNGNQALVYDVDFSPDDLSMLTASSGIKVWDYEFGTERFNLSAHRGEVTSMAYSADGNSLISGSWDNTAKLWSAGLRIELQRFKEHKAPVRDAAYSKDGQTIATVDDAGLIILHNAQSGEVVDAWVNPVNVTAVAIDPTNNQRVATGDSEGKIRIWVPGQSEPAQEISADPDHGIARILYSPDGTTLLVSAGNLATLWDAQTGQTLKTLGGGQSSDITDARFSDDGKFVVTASVDKTAQVWDLNNSAATPIVLTGHSDFVLAAVFSHDGAFVYTGSYDNTIRKWDARTGTLLKTFSGHTGRVLDLAISPDDKLLASGSADTTARVWEVTSGKEIFTYRGNTEDVNSVVFSPDGKNVLTASSDKTAKVFTIDFETLLSIAQQYELRPLTAEQCKRFLFRDDCSLTLFGQPAVSGTNNATTATPTSMPAATATTAAQPAEATATLAPTATSTPASNAAASGANYTETFNSAPAGWSSFLISGLENQFVLTPGADGLTVQLKAVEGRLAWVAFINTTATYTDVQVAATVVNTGNNANGASLICRHSAEGWYEFTVSNAGLYTIYAYDGVGGTGLVPGYNELAAGGSPAIKSGKSTNVYRAVCAGNELSLYVNDTLVKTITDTNFNFTEGAVGLAASSPQQLPVDLIFQAFTVSQP